MLYYQHLSFNSTSHNHQMSQSNKTTTIMQQNKITCQILRETIKKHHLYRIYRHNIFIVITAVCKVCGSEIGHKHLDFAGEIIVNGLGINEFNNHTYGGICDYYINCNFLHYAYNPKGETIKKTFDNEEEILDNYVALWTSIVDYLNKQ